MDVEKMKDQKDIHRLISALGDEDAWVRWRGLRLSARDIEFQLSRYV